MSEVPDPLRDAVVDAMEAMRVVLYEKAKQVVQELTAASESAGRQGLFVLEKIANVGFLYGEGKIDEETAMLSTKNYLATLDLEIHAIENHAQVLAYYEGLKALKLFAALALGVLEMAMTVAVPGLGVFLSGVVERVMGPKQ